MSESFTLEAIARGSDAGAVQKRAEVWVGISDLIFAVHQTGREQGGESVGVVGGTADGFEFGVDAAASLDADCHGLEFGRELRGGRELRRFRHELLHGQARIRGVEHGPDRAAAVGLIDQRGKVRVGIKALRLLRSARQSFFQAAGAGQMPRCWNR